MDDRVAQSLNETIKPAIVKRISVFELPIPIHLSETDLRIIEYLMLSGPRMEMSEIAKDLAISEKTTKRRLDMMKEGRLFDFSHQCDPASMIGYVQFTILINVETSHYRNVYECMYTEFQENILYFPSITDLNDLLISCIFGENVFMIDLVLAKVDSFDGVKNADVYILSKLQYHDDWIIREIDEKLLRQRTHSA